MLSDHIRIYVCMRFVVGCVVNGPSVRGRCWNPIEISLNTVICAKQPANLRLLSTRAFTWTGVQVTVVELLQFYHNSQR
ncbi:Disco-interacting protein [Trichinella pseudospiralis]